MQHQRSATTPEEAKERGWCLGVTYPASYCRSLGGKLVAVDLVEYNPLASSALFPAVTGALLLREVLILLDQDATVPG